jgi:hypothetical protein
LGFFDRLFNRNQPPKQKIELANDAERAWIIECLDNARRFVATFSPADKDQQLTLDALDRAFRAYCDHADRGDGQTINNVINAVGIAFGQHLVDQLGLEWAAVTDQFGCELAVVGMRGTRDFLVFPPNFVAKRWERREVDFLALSYNAIAADYNRLRNNA